MCSSKSVAGGNRTAHVMDHYTSLAISPTSYRFPPPSFSAPVSPPSSPADSPPASASALPDVLCAPSPILPLSPSLRELYLPPLSPEEILETLDHLAASAPNKKSHARKQPAWHIPLPRNTFILFRCLFVSQQAVPASVEKDHRNISRIAGKVWKSMRCAPSLLPPPPHVTPTPPQRRARAVALRRRGRKTRH